MVFRRDIVTVVMSISSFVIFTWIILLRGLGVVRTMRGIFSCYVGIVIAGRGRRARRSLSLSW